MKKSENRHRFLAFYQLVLNITLIIYNPNVSLLQKRFFLNFFKDTVIHEFVK